jgi:hypothetical protein
LNARCRSDWKRVSVRPRERDCRDSRERREETREEKGEKFKTVFPASERFLQFTGTVPLELPAPGDYRLDITADEEGRPFVYAYNIEATERTE